MLKDKQKFTIYFAGDLFDAKDLGGNLLLAEAIQKKSNGRYVIMLPQNGESEVVNRTSQSIRDADFELLYSCDMIVANFDGTDLDSGTVVEFCYAKMVDMPALLLRTDFRDGGDATLPDGEPWNLMCSHFPRTEVLHINAMMRYHDCMVQTSSIAERLELFYNSIAESVINSLDKVLQKESWLKKESALSQYQIAVKSMGGAMEQLLSESKLEQIVTQKISKNLF